MKLLRMHDDILRLEVLSAFHLIGNCHMVILLEIPFAFKTDTVAY